ncbi:hypothetical protein ACFQJC_14020 [Haloferax namakaokahaiae]|uniref:Tat (Twin-arginine translocation) pathway signal sequence n=1 Tax=Haloferax namakaokahaiae TaxID=1748331 RepID=A0ABD5ZHC0_9EURY
MPSRRQYLKAGVGLVGVGLAGCLSGSESPDAETETEDDSTATTATETPAIEGLPFGTETTVNGVTITPETVHPQASVFYISNVDWGDIERLDDEWVVFVSLSVRAASGSPPEKDSFRLVAGDEEFAPQDPVGDAPLNVVRPGGGITASPYSTEEDGGGLLAFAVPEAIDSASDLRLQYDDGDAIAHWSLPDDTKARIAGPRPTFELVTYDGPAQVPEGEVAELTITVRNTSSVDGVFRGSLNTTGLYAFHELSLPLEAGAEETVTHPLPVNNFVGEPNSSFSCNLRTGESEYEHSIEVVPKSDDS